MRENLARFIVERLLDLDPTLPDTEGSVVYTKVVDPLLERLGTDPMSVDIETFIISRLQAEFPLIDYASPGSVLRDLVVSPLVLLLDPLKTEIDFARKQNSLSDSASLTDDELDALLSNVFATRNIGSYALVTVRVFFSNPRAFSVDGSIVFSTAAGQTFVAQEPTNYLASDFVRSGNLYYVDIPLRSSTPTDTANVAANTIKFVNALDGVVRLTNVNASSGGVTRETNESFLARAERSLSERSLNTKRGIETNLLNNFSDIVSVDVVGYGDPDMQRDVLQAEVLLPGGPGPLLVTTNKFFTVTIDTGQLGLEFQFTNSLSVLKTAVSTSDVQVGNFVRVSDGDGYFNNPVLSRPRRIVSVVQDPTSNLYWKLTLADFEVPPGFPYVLFILNQHPRHGYNQYSRQGTSFQLFSPATVNNVTADYVRGAPLPVDEYVPVDFGAADVPSSAIPGRDFLIVLSAAEFNPAERFVRCYPIHAKKTDGVTISRLDSFLTNKDRISYQGAASFTYKSGPDVAMEQDGIQVIAFGGPALSKTVQNGRYDGLTKETWGSSAGVKLAKPAGNVPSTTNCTVELKAGNGGWAARGVKQRHYIALTRYDDQLNNADYAGTLADAASQMQWHAWGRIESISQDDLTITVSGMDWQQDAPANQADYRLFWTVYVGEQEVIAPDGTKSLSFTDQVFAPAYQNGNQAGLVHDPFPAPYRNQGYFDGEANAATAEPWATSGNYRTMWIRLERPFWETDPGIGGAPAQKSLSAHVTDLTKPQALANDRKLVSQFRYYGQASTSPLITKVALPYVEGAQALAKTTFATPPTPPPTSAPQVAPPASNPQDVAGYLLPSGFGSIGNPASQFLQFFAQATASQAAEDVSIVVSGIPGSLPFTNLLAQDVTVQNDQVHVGGMTDVYVKPATSSGETTGALRLVPQHVNPDSTSSTADVLFAGTDGSIDPADPTAFLSAQLLAGLTTLYSINNTKPFSSFDDIVLEILDPPDASLKPQVVRILHNLTGGVRVDGTFNPLNNQLVGLRWRVMRSATIDLGEALVVYQEGGDLVTVSNNASVQCPSGFSFTADPTAIQLYLSIDEGPDRGEYLVSAKTLNTLTIDRVVNNTLAGLSYRVYAKQLNPVQLPLIRVSQVALAGGQQGVTVPYKHPVDIVTSTFSGLNDDPVSSTNGLLLVVGDKLYLRDQNNANIFVTNNIGQYDVVRFESLDDPDKYFSVISRVAQAGNGLQVGDLELDRTMVSMPSGNVSYTAGHPSIGTAQMVFLQPTFVEITNNTIFSFTDAAGKLVKFRPSLAESALLYRAADTTTDVVPGVDGNGDLRHLTSASINLVGLGVQKGDKVSILTKVLTSSTLNTDQNLPYVGKNLVLVVDGVRYSVLLTGGVTTTLGAIANDITSQTGGLVEGKVQTLQNNQFALQLLSRRQVTLTDDGTPGLLVSLGLNLQVLNNYSVAQEGVVDQVTLSGGQARLVLSANMIGLTASDTVFVDVLRSGIQRVYPSDMTALETGLVAGTVKLTSYDPFVVDQAIQDQQVFASGYRSFGYELSTENNNYSYSVAEKVQLRVTSIMLDEAASSLEDALPLAGASVVVSYDRAGTVADIQSYMLQPEARVINNNPLVRHFLPAYPVMAIQYSGNVTVADLTSKVSTFLSSLYPNRSLEVFDLSTVLERAGATYVEFPQQVAFLTHDENRNIRLLRSENVLTLGAKFHIMEIVDDLVTITAV
jgi:hypothetical protein